MSLEFRRDFLKAGRALIVGSFVDRLLGTPKSSETVMPVSGGMLIGPGRLCQFSEDCPENRIEVSSPGLEKFIKSVKNGDGNLIAGVYIEDKLAFPVIKQPEGNSLYVAQWTVATEFNLKAYGVKDDTGLLIEAMYAPDTIYKVTKGDVVTLVSGSGTLKSFRVTGVRRFLALSPNRENSEFKELDENENPGEWYTAERLFKEMYSDSDALDDELVIQTCEFNDRNVPIIRRFIKAHLLD